MYDDSPKQALCEGEMILREPLLSERLQQKKDRLESELTQVNNAIATLKSNPGVEQTIDAISKALGRI